MDLYIVVSCNRIDNAKKKELQQSKEVAEKLRRYSKLTTLIMLIFEDGEQ